ncbi:MAG TPA: response regulator [Methylomirabilota bacterium]
MTERPARRPRVLVVDDETIIAQLIADTLGGEGYEVDTAPNGIVALERIAGKDYDLILSDLRMPELDGLGFYHELERERPDLLRRFVFITGTAEHADYRRVMGDVKVPLLTKPFDLIALQRVARETLSVSLG